MTGYTESGMLYEWSYSPNMSTQDQNELRDQKLYNALARYNYFQFYTEGRLAVFYAAQKLHIDSMTIIYESMLLHVTADPCVPFVNGHPDYSYILTQEDELFTDHLETEKYSLLAERYDH